MFLLSVPCFLLSSLPFAGIRAMPADGGRLRRKHGTSFTKSENLIDDTTPSVWSILDSCCILLYAAPNVFIVIYNIHIE